MRCEQHVARHTMCPVKCDITNGITTMQAIPLSHLALATPRRYILMAMESSLRISGSVHHFVICHQLISDQGTMS